ncbi:polysaccharide deacetylase [Rhizobium rhizosphaerae]|uniref:Polysaccharide deacetylase n=2 Tax=Xaviernesmea rhizosphaerae TaxID=1672749 RepID=A0A1Q9APE3_9HYPH|nr:polysaccharide deacetylase [Xaviernesmea rhizosphaerae]OLP57283.1 polysaccharide deacetylase [Xaviernesmea rhizosphaerae]
MLMHRLSVLPALFSALLLAPAIGTSAEAPRGPQLVIVSFDGAHDNALWARSLALAERTHAHFTYFLSCTFLMTRKEGGQAYVAPGHGPARSNVGFAQSREEIAERVRHIWQAHQGGHDIGSHACGHFDGKDWTAADWTREFSAFETALNGAWEAGGIKAEEPEDWRRFVREDISGFRAPYLSTSPGLLPAERKAGFRYDASLVTKGPALPVTEDGLPRFGLPTIAEGPSSRPVIAMDYNLFVRHSMGVENKKESAQFEERALSAYRAAFEAQVQGDRLPLQLGFHFVEMNGGAYWRALDRFLTETCGRQEVACVSYKEALERLKGETGQRPAVGSL